MNIENLTPAQTKAIEAGGTNNAVIGGSLVKRGVFEKTEGGIFKYMPAAEFLNWESSLNASPHIVEAIDAAEEKKFADAMQKEEDETPTSEDFELKMMAAANADAELALAEAVDADDVEAQKEILDNAAPLVLVSGQERKYSGGIWPVGPQGMTGDGIDAEHKKVFDIVRDPKETRYAHVSRWTDENLEVKYRILQQRLGRRTLLRADRMQAERHLQAVENELVHVRGIRP